MGTIRELFPDGDDSSLATLPPAPITLRSLCPETVGALCIHDLKEPPEQPYMEGTDCTEEGHPAGPGPPHLWLPKLTEQPHGGPDPLTDLQETPRAGSGVSAASLLSALLWPHLRRACTCLHPTAASSPSQLLLLPTQPRAPATSMLWTCAAWSMASFPFALLPTPYSVPSSGVTAAGTLLSAWRQQPLPPFTESGGGWGAFLLQLWDFSPSLTASLPLRK